MRLRYKHQRFQTEAARCVVNVFTGQPKSDGQSDHIVDQGTKRGFFHVEGFGNRNIILLVAMLSILWQTWRAASCNPSKTLRSNE